jgi:hypothetical protein
MGGNICETDMMSTSFPACEFEFMKDRLPLVPLTTPGPPTETEVNLHTPVVEKIPDPTRRDMPPVLEIEDEDDDEFDDDLSLHHSSSGTAEVERMSDSEDKMEVDTDVSTRRAEEGHAKYI